MTKLRAIEPHDLELFTINTGAFYAQHKHLATKNAPMWKWLAHIRYTALPRYCKEIEPVTAAPETIRTVAKALADYYAQHIKELTP